MATLIFSHTNAHNKAHHSQPLAARTVCYAVRLYAQRNVLNRRFLMHSYLYRGVSIIEDEKNNGLIKPKGEESIAVPRVGDEGFKIGSGYVIGRSEGNAVRAHQIDSGMKELAYISTTRCKEIAKKFATSDNIEDGYIYTLDSSQFPKHRVTIHELESVVNDHEEEVTIKSIDNGIIPAAVIVKKELVKCT